MARIRMVKPEFFDDPDIGDLSLAARLLFIGLWTQADREGRLRDDPRRLKARLFPFDTIDVEQLLDELHRQDFIRRYKDSSGTGLAWIRKFTQHQRPHPKEMESVLAACPPDGGQHTTQELLSPEKVVTGRDRDVSSPPESGVRNLDSGVLSTDSETRNTEAGTRATKEPLAQAPERKPKTGQGNGAFGARGLPREHLSHEVCGARVCLPRHQFVEFVGKCGTGLDEHDVRTWAESVIAEWDQPPKCDETIRGTVFQFWAARWEEWQGTAVRSRQRASDVGSVSHEWNCSHQPHCGSPWKCNQRTQLDEARELREAQKAQRV